MKYTEALQAILEAAGIRRDQWQQCASEGTPDNCIKELWEAGHDEAQEMADILTGALKVVRNRATVRAGQTVRTAGPVELNRITSPGESKRIYAVITQLAELDSTLAEIVMDYQDAAEEAGNTSSGFGDICVPEDANEPVDGVRVHIDEAMTQLYRYLDILKEQNS